MITLYHQSGQDRTKWIPNSIPRSFRNYESYKRNVFKSVKPKFISEMCDYLDLPYKQVSAEEYQGEHAFYHIEIDWIDQAFVYRNVFNFINKPVRKLLRNPKSKLKLLLWFPNEGFSLDMPRFIDIIDFCIKDFNIPENKVFLVFGDLNIKQNYEYYRKKKGLSNINVYGMDSFETTYNKEISLMSMDDINLITENDFLNHWGKERSKKFIFKNANPRPQRIFFAAELHKRKQLEQSYYSWLNRYFKPSMDRSPLQKYGEDSNELFQSMQEFLSGAPYILDYDGDQIGDWLNQRVLINNHYLDSYFSFVTETTYEESGDEDVLFITEKTYQPIVNYHPFITASQINTLEYLKENGYATFPELFDESYDKETDVKKRSQIILNSIENFNKDIYFSNEIRDKLIHNRNNFFERKGKQHWVDVFNWLESYRDL